MKQQMSTEELLALPVAVDLDTAGRAFGLGRTKAHELARTGQFPCPVLRLGKRYRVTKAAILEALGVAAEMPLPASASGDPEAA